MSRALVIAAVAVALVAGAGAARAQSPRYPAPPGDPDAAAEAHSSFWEAAMEPGLVRYRQLVDQARRAIETRDLEPIAQAAELLGDATRLAPGRAEGWWYLGVAREAREDWAGCAAAYQEAWKIDPALAIRPALRARPELDHALGVCLARAGRLDDARAHLARLAQAGDADSEVWLRLGEVYMGLGRLADAIDVIGRAADDAAISPDVAWALAIALDRARRDADAEEQLATALRLDPSLTRVAAPAVPYLSEAEGFYYQGVAAQAAQQPERAIVYLRQFAAQAPTSPWRARAEQHLADLAQTDWPARLELLGAGAIDRGKAVAALRAGWSRIAACAHGHPGVLIRVNVVVLGPTPLGRERMSGPAPGTRATALTAFGDTDESLAKVLSCVEDGAGALAFPRPKEPNVFARISFPVVSR
jgi:tetratricopeptide (TPR) repeat protein